MKTPLTQINHLSFPKKDHKHVWQSAFGASGTSALAALTEKENQFCVYVAATSEIARQVAQELDFFSSKDFTRLVLPEWETLPYDLFSPHGDIVSERLSTLASLPSLKTGVLVVTASTLMQRLPPPQYIINNTFDLQVGKQFDPLTQREKLISCGYRTVDTVFNRGELAIRGSIFDLFPMGSDLPIRIDIFDSEIETLRTFDPDTQRTIEQTNLMQILPGKEFPLDQIGIERFKKSWHESFVTDVRNCPLYQDVNSGIAPQGLEYYFPFFFEKTGTLFDYLPQNTLFALETEADSAANDFSELVRTRYESYRYDTERPIPPPEAIYLTWHQVLDRLGQERQILIDHKQQKTKHVVNLGGKPLPDIVINHRLNDPIKSLRAFVANIDANVLFTAPTNGRLEHLLNLLQKFGLQITPLENIDEFVSNQPPLAITKASIERGLWNTSIAIITETNILGTQSATDASSHRSKTNDPDTIIRNLTELSIDAPVVHLDHGVGRYKGLEILEIDEQTVEFLSLLYADNAKLYVPVTSLHLISRYTGASADSAPLHRLGSDQWEKAKKRAAEKARDAAAELLDIYARRKASKGRAFEIPGDDYYKFCAQFPYRLTKDQETAIDSLITDLTSPLATDRLICGDVGFGKTEVAMRAAYLAVQSGLQVAVLVPTTLLAQQHYETFCDRFAGWPHEIEFLSRMRSATDAQEIGARLKNGSIDIVIGTHRLLSPAVKYDQLGLVIIDEEHRFGVQQKEALKSLRTDTDILTLTATPIPRTLNMAMSGMRDLSIIATPPAKRLSIKTFVIQSSDQIIKEAVQRELSRGGQVFYVHNEVQSIETATRKLAKLVPNARIGVGHGQLPKRELEKVMSEFYHGQLNILVCTTIIETGIDIPNANTIIIERADKFGLAQLHQLRGRVGRSTRQAYAYLLTTHPKSIRPDSKKRLEAIELAGDLGAGFTLATHDLEIRGAGEFLGDEQSGQIQTIGFSLYLEMLNRAVETIRDGGSFELTKPLQTTHEVNLHIPTLIPEDYLPDVHNRLIMYKRISNTKNNSEILDLQSEMIDRFGNLPESISNLFEVTRVKLKALLAGIERIDFGDKGGRIEFGQQPNIDTEALVRMIEKQSDLFSMVDGNRLRLHHQTDTGNQRLELIITMLDTLTANKH